MADKARDAFRTISEVANWLDIPAHVLRFWESKFPQIKPVKRAGGRRYYRPADMCLIGGIKKLLHDDGLTIRGVQKMLKEDGVKTISELAPPLDMPTEEEGAARRQARRARRQERQAARSTAPPEAEEAPFTHVEDEPTGGDNVVSIIGHREEAPGIEATDAADDIPEPALSAEQLPDESDVAEQSPAPDIQDPVVEDEIEAEIVEEPAALASEPIADIPAAALPEELQEPESEVEADVEDASPEPETETPTPTPTPELAPIEPVSTIPTPAVVDEELEVEELAEEPEPVELEQAAAPQPDIPADPDPATITLTDAQTATAAALKRLRRQSVSAKPDAESDAIRRAALDKLTDLRARMASNLG